MSVSILVVYTGEETIRNWLQTKVKERQLYIRNDPGELEAGMKTVDKTLHPGGLNIDFAFL